MVKTKCGSCGKERFTATIPKKDLCRRCSKIEHHKIGGTTRHKFSGLYSCIKQKCYNQNNSLFHTYGAKGIIVCQEWLNDRELFFTFLEEKNYDPKKNRLTRLDKSGPFSPENCIVTLKGKTHENSRTINRTES